MKRSMRSVIFFLVFSLLAASSFSVPNIAQAQGSFLGHIVEPGETLESIAAKHHTTPEAIIQENQLPTPVQLVPGQLLRIRNWSDAPVAADPAAVPPSAPAGEPQGIPLWEQDLPGERWIEIDLGTQTLTAHVGDVAVRSFVISSGGKGHETVTGSFRVWAKVSRQDMSGGSRAAGNYYYVPNVPWVQYFYADYSIHGADWHDDFGYPVSHGCVNMRVPDAKWLFEWASPHIDETRVANGTWVFPGSDSVRVEVHD